MASHGVARSARIRTDEQRQQDAEKIRKYRDLEDQIRAKASIQAYTPETLSLTTKILRLNPEYYTVWNARRHCLISGPLRKHSPSCSALTGLSSSTANPTSSGSSADALSSSSVTQDETRQDRKCQTTGPTGTITDATAQIAPRDHEAEGTSALKGTTARVDDKGEADYLPTLQQELMFTVPLLMNFPKCYWIWKYRLWVLGQCIHLLPSQVSRRVWEEELGLVGKMLTKDRRNFHAWGYRKHLVAKLESDELQGSSLVEQEFEYTTKMINGDLSNFSAWHNRARLIPRLLDERGVGAEGRTKFFEAELQLITDAVNVGPEDQSLWNYHQFLMLQLVETSSFVSHFTAEQKTEYLEREIKGIKELLEDYDDVKWIYEVLFEYTLTICKIQTRAPADDEKASLKTWLTKLRSLDPMRRGRWNDIEKEWNLI